MTQKQPNYHFEGLNLPEKDREWGRKLFDDYIAFFPHLNNLGNARLLEELVWAEIMLERMKQAISEKCKATEKHNQADTYTSTVGEKEQKNLQEARNQVLDLKKNLGMFEANKIKDSFQQIDELKAKFKA